QGLRALSRSSNFLYINGSSEFTSGSYFGGNVQVGGTLRVNGSINFDGSNAFNETEVIKWNTAAFLGTVTQDDTYLYINRTSTGTGTVMYVVQASTGPIAKFGTGTLGSTVLTNYVELTNAGGIITTGDVNVGGSINFGGSNAFNGTEVALWNTAAFLGYTSNSDTFLLLNRGVTGSGAPLYVTQTSTGQLARFGTGSYGAAPTANTVTLTNAGGVQATDVVQGSDSLMLAVYRRRMWCKALTLSLRALTAG
ncbi:MAG: hypothetical protein ACYSW8_31395, partial [Planctomycetota bacterium]